MKQLSLQRCVADCWKRRNIIDMKYDKERGRGPAATLVQEQDFLMVSCAAQGMSWGYLLCGTLLATGNPLIRCSLRLLVCVLFFAAPFLTVLCLALLHPTLGVASADKTAAGFCLALLHLQGRLLLAAPHPYLLSILLCMPFCWAG